MEAGGNGRGVSNNIALPEKLNGHKHIARAVFDLQKGRLTRESGSLSLVGQIPL